MKRIKLLVIATLAFVGLTMQAQEVKQIEASVDDYDKYRTLITMLGICIPRRNYLYLRKRRL